MSSKTCFECGDKIRISSDKVQRVYYKSKKVPLCPSCFLLCFLPHTDYKIEKN